MSHSARPTNRTSVFISYSHRDSRWLQRLRVHLRPLEREGRLTVWDDTRIRPGLKWRDAIKDALESAKVAVLLITADYLASDFIATDELRPLLSAAEKEGAVILPVIVGPSSFLRIEQLSVFQAVNDPAKPLMKLSRANQEAILVEVAERISVALGPAEVASSTTHGSHRRRLPKRASEEGELPPDLQLRAMGIPPRVSAFRHAITEGNARVTELLLLVGVSPDTL